MTCDAMPCLSDDVSSIDEAYAYGVMAATYGLYAISCS